MQINGYKRWRSEERWTFAHDLLGQSLRKLVKWTLERLRTKDNFSILIQRSHEPSELPV